MSFGASNPTPAMDRLMKLVSEQSGNDEEPVSIEQVLQCEDLTNAYKKNDPAFIKYMRQRKHAVGLYEFIATTKDKNVLKPILSLFLTSNTTFHVLFEDLEVCEYCAKLLDEIESDSGKMFAIGTISRVIIRAVDQSPDFISTNLRISQTIIPRLIAHIDLPTVYQTCLDLISETNKEFETFAWHLFSALSGVTVDPESADCPFCVFMDKPIDLSKVREILTIEHKKRIVSILRQLFQCKRKPEKNFVNQIKKWLNDGADFDQMPFLCEFLGDLPKDEQLLTKLIVIAENALQNQKFQLLEHALNGLNGFISANQSPSDEITEKLVSLLERIFVESRATLFSLQATEDLVSAISEIPILEKKMDRYGMDQSQSKQKNLKGNLKNRTYLVQAIKRAWQTVRNWDISEAIPLKVKTSHLAIILEAATRSTIPEVIDHG